MRKAWKWASVLLVGSLAVTGCGKTQVTGGEEKPAAGKTTKISFIHWRGEDTKVFNDLIAEFKKANPTIDVEMNVFPSESYLANAQAKLLDGSSGDVFASFPGAQFESISKANLYEDLSKESFVSNYTENLIQAGKKDGKQLAFPYQLVYNQPIYNKAIFDKLGLKPPKDWDGFLKLCETLKNSGYIPIAFPGQDIGPGQFMNSMMMNNNTDEAIWSKVESGQAKLTDEWFVKTLSQFKELADKGYFQKDSLGTNKDIAGSLFAQEKAAMLATGSYMMSSNKQQNPNLVQGLLAPITVSADKAVFEGIHTTTFMLGVNANSKHKPEAKKFIEFLSQKENAQKYANQTGQLVTVKGVNYETAELKESAQWADKKTRFHPRYLIANANNEKAVVSSIQAVVSGKSPEEAAKAAQVVIDQNVKK
ncbi:ABC transporter substrate-binding protein [Paenibacillus rigui]|uniref:ABC transporter substrate-binding protein n=1 Tax=Paenibacillus rigui TaxID=554312 RepID=A0A229UQQ5_9BACL|nr:ABC transporter substrate-binding protein [Paenibacillus rigui]OXM85752.1 ABC transporter substrate-binding protein [Paenibacillus rigui]